MRLILFLLSFVAAGAAYAQADKLGNGDAVRVTVFGQPELLTEGRISDKGDIALPLVGEVKISGLSAADAGTRIAEAYKKGQYLKAPQVTVAITALRSRQVSVLGMVARPGRYPLDDTSSKLADVIAAAGGLTPEGSDQVTVIRNGKPRTVAALGKDFNLEAGDTVQVERAPVFYIYGEVARAGAYRVEPGMTVMQAVSVGGGITPRGSDRRMKLRRPGTDGKVQEKDAALSDVVRSGDVIYVREALF